MRLARIGDGKVPACCSYPPASPPRPSRGCPSTWPTAPACCCACSASASAAARDVLAMTYAHPRIELAVSADERHLTLLRGRLENAIDVLDVS